MAVKDSTYGATGAAPANVQVIAPATLKAGYTFDAMYDGVTFTVTVPDGGVTKGQRFVVPFTPPAETGPVAIAVPADAGSASAARSAQKGAHHSIPTGIWRDGLCDCCRFGPFHPHFLCAVCFQPCLLGQIMTRMKMTWLGQRTRNNAGSGGGSGNVYDGLALVNSPWKNTFRNIVMATLAFYVVQILTTTPHPAPINDGVTWDQPLDESAYYGQLSDVDKAKYTVNSWISTFFGFYIFYIMIQLRATLRHVYSIPEESCLCLYQLGCGSNPRDGICGTNNRSCAAGVPIGWEDLCCSMWCQLCILAQMARHTVDYDEDKADCCNATGVMDWDDDEAYEGVEDGHVGEGSVLVV